MRESHFFSPWDEFALAMLAVARAIWGNNVAAQVNKFPRVVREDRGATWGGV